MNFGDPELELIDPTPNIFSLFIHFDKLFFWTKLASRAVVRWSKRMYSCAGVCSYEGSGGICDIALSEPLLKLRPRKDLVETLLHEMIHAYLFITNRDRDRDGHGPNFQAHMHRINKIAGLNISIYHNFHDEVKLYQTHWWRCNGPCQKMKPYFGIVRRPMNRPPGPSDYWWKNHNTRCGGTFIKIKEPEPKGKKVSVSKAKGAITKYINNNNKIVNNNLPKNSKTPILKDSSNIPSKTNIKTNVRSTGVVSKKEIINNPKATTPTPLFTGKGHTVDGNRHRTNSAGVVETVRNVWLNKQLPGTPPSKRNEPVKNSVNNLGNPNKHKILSPHTDSPPRKINKIDNYFKTTATSVLKDVYGQDFKVTQSNDGKKLVAITAQNLVDCPVCQSKVKSNEINKHLDECLNKDVLEKLCKESTLNQFVTPNQPHVDRNRLKEIVGILPTIPIFKELPNVSKFQIDNKDIKLEIPDNMNESFMDDLISSQPEKRRGTTCESTNVDAIKPNNIDLELVKDQIWNKKIGEPSLKIIIKTEPGTSKGTLSNSEKICPCCGNKLDKPVEQHLDECPVLVNVPKIPVGSSHINDPIVLDDNTSTMPVKASPPPDVNDAIVIDDDDDIFDESQTFNATGTKTPCPCCLKMIEQTDMNDHLDICLS